MYFFFNSSMWISNLRSVNLFSTLQTPQLSHSFALRNQGFFDYITQVSQVCISLASPPSERRNDAEYLRNCSYIMCCRYFICHLSATVSATVQLFTNQRIICVWLQVADVFIFFRFFVKFGGNLFFISTVFFFLNPIKSCRYVCFLVTLKTPHH